ncbi:MAG: phospholipase D-like domain-containing protein [Nocardioidaceae bacterium]
MLPRLATALAGPALLVGLVYPGWGGAPTDRLLPDAGVASVPPAPSPDSSVAFNDPAGPPAQQYSLITRVDRAVDAAWPGSTIRVAEYSFAMPRTSAALGAAYRRGVNVQVVVDDHSAPWRSVRRLSAVLGTDTTSTSFVKVCRASCRGGRGNQHAKFLTLSGTGSSVDVLMVGSVNFTNFNARLQWNDLYTVRTDPLLYAQFNKLFALMVEDRRQPRLRLPDPGHGFGTEVSPMLHGGDPIAERLHKVRCSGAAPGAGRHGRTVVRVAMHAWNGDRGLRLAREVARLQRHGCDVRVLYGVGMGGRVADVLRAAGVPMRDSARDGRRVHEKVMVLSGVLGRDRHANYVWTGSHNWSDRSLRNDEVILRVPGRSVVASYLRNFRRMWDFAGR